MAILFSSAFQHLKGKIGNLILYNIKGQIRIRSHTRKVFSKKRSRFH